MPWNQTRQNLSNHVDQVGTPSGTPSGTPHPSDNQGSFSSAFVPASHRLGAPPAAGPDQSEAPLTPLTGSLGDQLGSAGILGGWRTSVAGAGKGWHDLLAPSPPNPNPPLTSEQQAKQNVHKVTTTIRLVQQTVGAVLGLVALPKEMLDVGFANLTAPLAALFPSLPSATLTTMYVGTPHAHSHPPSFIPPAPPIPLPSLGPVTLGTCVRVLINNLPAARCKDLGYAFTCGGLAPLFQIKTGSSNVFIAGHRAARMGDICVACVKGESRNPTEAGAFLAALGKMARAVSKGLAILGDVAAVAGIVADVAEAVEADVNDEAAMSSAKALAAAMTVAQLAADAIAAALSQTMGTDPGIPPSIGALLVGHPTVLIGGFPMIDIPNPINLLLDRLSKFVPKSPREDEGVGGRSCPG